MENKSVRIKVDRVTPRLVYTCGILFESILERTVELVTEGDCDLVYAAAQPEGSTWFIPCNGLLLESDLRSENPFPSPLGQLPPLAEFDFLAWCFFHLTLYAEVFGEAAHEDSLKQVWVEDIAFHISDALDWARPAPRFDYEITIDVDHPWKHRYKPFVVQAGGLFVDFLKGRREMVAERWQAIRHGLDPFDIDGLIADMCPPEKTTLFYLVDGAHPNDSRFSLAQPPYAYRVQRFSSVGFGTGLHPSYESSEDPDLFMLQKQLLDTTLNMDVTSSRQHYLRFKVPETFRDLLEVGIQREYSICFNRILGARTRIVRPYPWFDLGKNTATDLELVPAQAMDRTLQQYLKLTPEEAWEKVAPLIARVRAANGKFVVILHNETFSESGEWVGWRHFIKQLLEELKAYAG